MKQIYFLNTFENVTVLYLQENVVFSFLLFPVSPDISLRMGGPIARSLVARREYDSSMVSIPRELSLKGHLCLIPGKNEPEMEDAIHVALPKKQAVLQLVLKIVLWCR